MSEKLDKKVRGALNETRLLILGVQVLLGFQFQSFFQDGFSELSRISQWLCMIALLLLTLAAGLLVIPSMIHRIVNEGSSSDRLLGETSGLTALALTPIAVSLGMSTYIVIDRHFGHPAGIASGLAMVTLAAFAWFGAEMLYGIATPERKSGMHNTPLSTKIEQLLTEARVIIPGAQALFGFQFIAMLTTGFDRLPEATKIVHAAALCAVAINVILLMTPAALHRLSFNGEDSESFLRIGSALIIAAPAFLAAGIAGEIYVVFHKIAENTASPLAAAIASFGVLIVFWYIAPLWLRRYATK